MYKFYIIFASIIQIRGKNEVRKLFSQFKRKQEK